MNTPRKRGFLCTLMRFVRPFAWLACCFAAVAIHHVWFDIGKRGVLIAFADGIILLLLSVGMHWAHRKLYVQNATGYPRPDCWKSGDNDNG